MPSRPHLARSPPRRRNHARGATPPARTGTARGPRPASRTTSARSSLPRAPPGRGRTRPRSRTARSATCGSRSPTSRRGRRRRPGAAATGSPPPTGRTRRRRAATRRTSRSVGDLAERVERAAVHVARLRADDRRALAVRQRLRQRLRPASGPRRRPGSARGAPRPEVAQRQVDRRVRLLAGEHAHPRRALQAVALDVPAGALQHRVPRRRKAGEVRHLGAGGEAERRRPPAARAARPARRPPPPRPRRPPAT